MGKQKEHAVLLAVSLGSSGLGFALFENPTKPVDWGVKNARMCKLTTFERHVESTISFYQPDALVIEHPTDAPSRYTATKLYHNLVRLGDMRQLAVEEYTREDVKDVFAQYGPTTKFGITRTIATWLPQLKAQLPRYRHPWMSEDHIAPAFEAIALALTHYYRTD